MNNIIYLMDFQILFLNFFNGNFQVIKIKKQFIIWKKGNSSNYFYLFDFSTCCSKHI